MIQQPQVPPTAQLQHDETYTKTRERLNDIYLVTMAVLKILDISDKSNQDNALINKESNIERFRKDLKRLDKMTCIYNCIIHYDDLIKSLFPDFYKSELRKRIVIHQKAQEAKGK